MTINNFYLLKKKINYTTASKVLSYYNFHKPVQDFAKLILKKGKKKKVLLMISTIFEMFNKLIKQFTFYKNFPLQNFLEIYTYNLKANRNLYLINFILREVFNLLNPAFNYKLTIQNKKKRKKTKKKYKAQISYIFPNKRISLVYR